MSIKKLIPAGVAAFAAVAMAVVLVPVQAAVQPYVEGGDIYRVRNVTKGGDFTDPASADKCQELQYRVRVHNPGPDAALENVTVKAVIPPAASTQNVSTVTVSATNSSPTSRSDTATVNLAGSYKISYVPGSSQLLDANGGVIRGIGDVTSGAGANIGKVGISVNEKRFVQFKAKVDCPQPPKPPEKFFKCEALNMATADMKSFRFDAVARVQNVTVQSYTFNVTRNGQQFDNKTVTTNALTARYDLTNPGPGTYTVTAVINTSAGSTNPEMCKKTVKVPEEPKPDKKFKCEALNVTTTDNKNYKFEAKASVQNVTVQSYVFSAYKNGSLVDQKTVTTNALTAGYDFSQTGEGKYIVTAVVNTDAGSTNPKDCAKEITVPGDNTPPTPPVVPPEVPPYYPPSVPEGEVGSVSAAVLPETGPADTAAIIALVTVVSTTAYYLTARKFGSL